ncbi:3'-5' exonuclease [Arcanobacterium hippocoleae]
MIRAMVALRSAAREESPQTASKPLSECIAGVLWQLGWRKEAPAAPGASRERWESLDVIRQMGEKFAKEHTVQQSFSGRTAPITVHAFVVYLEDRARFEIEPQLECVTLSSLHSAKGLEWPIVFLAGVNEGLLPISHARTAAGIAEERRLFYVGITRAADELYISCSKANINGKKRKASQFLQQIWPREISRSALKRRNAKENQIRFRTEHPEAMQLFTALCEWRTNISRAENKPAYTIFHDTVLYRIAAEKPKSLDELRLIKGIGTMKLAKYGEEILALIQSFRF